MQQRFVADIHVFAGGYEWWDSGAYHQSGLLSVQGKSAAAQRRLLGVPDKPDADNSSSRHYDPFRDAPALFLELAENGESEENIRHFANQYGTLWSDLKGPNLLDWRHTIRDLRGAVALWQAVVKRDRGALAEFVGWERGRLCWKSNFAKPIDEKGRALYGIELQTKLPPFKSGDLLGPATALLDYVLATMPAWNLSIAPVRRGESLELQLSVQTLLSVVWMQFALAVGESKSYGRCEFCGRSFEKGLVREDRTFCSDNCRVKNHQRRRKQARCSLIVRENLHRRLRRLSDRT